MKKCLITYLFAIILPATLMAQSAIINMQIMNASPDSCTFIRNSLNYVSYSLKKGYDEVAVNKAGKCTYEINLTRPQFITLYCDSSKTRHKTLSFSFYLSPGDNLQVAADFLKPNFGLKITGKGSNNNQPSRIKLFSDDFDEFTNDTLPDRLISAIVKTERAYKDSLTRYIEINKPTDAFIKDIQYSLDYYSPLTFYSFKENNKFNLSEKYYKNIDRWQHVTDSLFIQHKLNNIDAISSSKYCSLLRSFLLRQKEALWMQQSKDSVAFYRDWYNTDVKNGKSQYFADRVNLLKEKIINRYFTGPVAEYLYAQLFDEAIDEANPANIVTIFGRFQQKYPQSEYINWFSPSIDKIKQNEQNTVNEHMVFVKDNGINLNNFEDILKLAKGKTVLLDMWGTWCSPCRSSIEQHSAKIKEHFKNKGLDYFYIANHDLKNELVWKKLIAYFKLTGTHILANENLSDDIMKKVKGPGYPTYVIIKKDGSYELSKAGYPMDRQVLINQLEQALAMSKN